MPRKTKITAVPVDQPEGLARAWGEEEGNTDAEQMTDIINEVSLAQKVETLPEESQDTENAKPKRASRAKPKEPPTEEPKEPPTEVPPKEEPREEPKEDQGAGAKVECPDCGKQMSATAKTLRYSHGANCSAKQGKQQRAQEEQPAPNVMDDLIEYEVQRRMNQKRAERATRREAMVAKLLQNAF